VGGSSSAMLDAPALFCYVCVCLWLEATWAQIAYSASPHINPVPLF